MSTPDLAGPLPAHVEPVPADAGLRRRYREYRERQGAALLSLVPREGVRALHRSLRGAAPTGDGTLIDDPMRALAARATELLPLPPFAVWKRDFLRHRAAHLEEAAADAPSGEGTPVTVELAAFEDAGGRSWYASLDLFRSGGGWSGSIAFHTPSGSRSCRTGEIFREPDAEAVRERFRGFDRATLGAFLRSALP